MNVPDGLADAGSELWRSVTDDFDLGPDEVSVLLESCRTADELARLHEAVKDADPMVHGSTGQPVVNPLFAECRLHRATLVKLLAALKLGDADSGKPPEAQWRTDRARDAARSRWHGVA